MTGNNYHTHTLFCDGKDTPEELVRQAISLGCSEIGFSGHSFTDIPDPNPFCMTREGTVQYKAEINRLKEKYKGQITILLGVEQDYFSPLDTADYEYVIGSVHYVYRDGEYLPVDESREKQIQIVKEHYDGDFYALAEDYFYLVGNLFEKTKCHIVGHFDLITKFNENNCLFDTHHPRYTECADRALEKLMHRGLTFEINYGAIARGYRTLPYPERRILAILQENGEKTMPSSDCHDKKNLLFGFEAL